METFTKEKCIELALKYKTRSNFSHNNYVAYKYAKKMGWIDELLPCLVKNREKYTYEYCYEIAKKYQKYNEFRSNETNIYQKAIRKKWIKDYTWLERGFDLIKTNHCIYIYYFPKSNVYIGRTCRLTQRCYNHLHDKNDSVYRYIQEYNMYNKFDFEILESKLTAKESAIRECYWIDFYKEQGYNLINRIKGGSLGGIQYWTLEECKRIAGLCNTRTEMYNKYKGAYYASLRNGWMELLGLESTRHNKWTEKEFLKLADNYVSSSQFKKEHGGLYETARRQGWLKHANWVNQHYHPVLEYDLSGNFIQEHLNLLEFDKGTARKIINCAAGRKKVSNNRIWKYKKSDDYPLKINVGVLHNEMIPILQYDLEGNFIKEYPSIASTGYSYQVVKNCLEGKSTSSKGYIWKYKNK